MSENPWKPLVPILHPVGLATMYELKYSRGQAMGLVVKVAERDGALALKAIEIEDLTETGTHLVEYNRELVSQNIELTALVPKPPPETAIVREVPAGDLCTLLHFLMGPNVRLRLGDGHYPLCTFEDILPIVQWWRDLPSVQQMLYVLHLQDCDDYSLAFAGDMSKFKPICGFPFFLCWGGHPLGCHAWNFVVFHDPTEDAMWADSTGNGLGIAFIEPQNGEVEKLALALFTDDDEYEMYIALTS